MFEREREGRNVFMCSQIFLKLKTNTKIKRGLHSRINEKTAAKKTAKILLVTKNIIISYLLNSHFMSSKK